MQKWEETINGSISEDKNENISISERYSNDELFSKCTGSVYGLFIKGLP